ncbi:MAG: DUF4838 domain-containing protein [Clostridia bacterium]|nr:DUF4838 domain-containing protein [Clostridia bacterium]
MQIVKNDRIDILIPKNATPRESFAASELKKYLELMLDASVRMTHEADGKNARFIIGGPERNPACASLISVDDFKNEVPGPEGMMIRSVGDNTVIIAGSNGNVGEKERGTVYGVYEFLERFCSCTLAAFSHPDVDAGEIVPRHERLDLNDINYVKSAADRPYRTAIIQYADAAGNPDKVLNLPFFDWLVKNRYNRILTWTSIYDHFKSTELLGEIERRGLGLTVGHHESSRLFLPAYGNEFFPEKYYETHPEFFKLQKDGSRFLNQDPWGQWVYCSRNADAIKEVANNIIRWLERNPAVDILAMWPNDGISEQCNCPECAKYSKIENYAYFVNEIAKLVGKKHPNVKFDMLIYVDLWECPDGIKLEPSIMIDESTWHYDGLRRTGKPDGSCLNGTHFEDNLLKWHKAGAEVVYYDYYMGIYSLRQRWIPMADELQAIWKNFAKTEISGSGTQIECFNIWNHLLNFYTFARTGYDTEISLERSINSLCRLYGKGGEAVAEIFTELEELLDGQVEIPDCGHFLMENVDKEKIYSKFEQAFSLAETPRERNNLRLTRMVFRYSDLETQDPASRNEKYESVFDDYVDESGELAKMTEYDSFMKNDPGYAITIPLSSKKTNYVPDKWYLFE